MSNEHTLESRYLEVGLDQGVVKVHYHDLGKPHSPLPVLVMLHGSGPAACGAHNFRHNIETFLRQGFRIILLDWPGWGKSDAIVSTGARSSLNAQVLKRVLDTLKIANPVHLVGNSMGAHSATAFAIDNPGRIAKLVLIGGGNGGRSTFQAARTEGIEKIVAFYRQPNLERMRDFLCVVTHNRSSVTEQAVLSRFNAAMARLDHLECYAASVQANPNPYPDVGHRLAEITVPTLIFWGQEDRVVPLDLGMRVASLIPHADMHIFSQCGHVPHTEQAKKFNQLTSWFLSQHAVSTAEP